MRDKTWYEEEAGRLERLGLKRPDLFGKDDVKRIRKRSMIKLSAKDVKRIMQALKCGENYADLCAVDDDWRAKRALAQIQRTMKWLGEKK